MSYLALARQWRPRTFSQLVGQEHINKVLINSLKQQRLHHAYLFTGTRGVGKTSVARLLAKAVNCELGITAEPCLQCESCIAIEQGRFIDLIEIDGASRTRVEDTREVLENVQYAPTVGRFKIYLIDEVHMLSQHSFNALLKTLEEPPHHVKFLLATTDPQKLPVTVLSRCLQFHLRPLSPDTITQQLQLILDQEQLTFEAEALGILAQAAKGSMRDALSLLDQAIASCNNHINIEDVKSILGYTHQDYSIQLLQSLALFNPQQIIQICRQIAAEGGHFDYVLDELLHHLHQITIGQALANEHPLIEMDPQVHRLMNQFSPEDIQLFYQIAIKGTEEMHLAPTLSIGFEMTLLRMLTFRPAPKADEPLLCYELAQTRQPSSGTPKDKDNIANQHPLAANSLDAQVPTPPPLPPSIQDLIKPASWGEILTQLKLTGLAQTAAESAELIEKSKGNIALRITKGHQSLFTPTILKRIEQSLTNYYQETIKITLHSENTVHSSPAQQRKAQQDKQQQEAEHSLQQDPFFQKLRQEFSGEVVKNYTISKDSL